MPNYTNLTSLFTAIANAIRSKTGGTGSIVADNFPAAIGEIVTDPSLNDTLSDAQYLLSPYTAHSKGTKFTGTMTNQGAKTASLNCGGSYTIPKGYHNGSGKVTANSLASQTAGTATAADIANGKTAWVGGSKITGNAEIKTKTRVTLKNNKAITATVYYEGNTETLAASGSLTISVCLPCIVYITKYDSLAWEAPTVTGATYTSLNLSVSGKNAYHTFKLS